jgi:hypothetical protein
MTKAEAMREERNRGARKFPSTPMTFHRKTWGLDTCKPAWRSESGMQQIWSSSKQTGPSHHQAEAGELRVKGET